MLIIRFDFTSVQQNMRDLLVSSAVVLIVAFLFRKRRPRRDVDEEPPLQSLDVMIGPKPTNRTWRDEWEQVNPNPSPNSNRVTLTLTRALTLTLTLTLTSTLILTLN